MRMKALAISRIVFDAMRQARRKENLGVVGREENPGMIRIPSFINSTVDFFSLSRNLLTAFSTLIVTKAYQQGRLFGKADAKHANGFRHCLVKIHKEGRALQFDEL
jgi:hypothetical protein